MRVTVGSGIGPDCDGKQQTLSLSREGGSRSHWQSGPISNLLLACAVREAGTWAALLKSVCACMKLPVYTLRDRDFFFHTEIFGIISCLLLSCIFLFMHRNGIKLKENIHHCGLQTGDCWSFRHACWFPLEGSCTSSPGMWFQQQTLSKGSKNVAVVIPCKAWDHVATRCVAIVEALQVLGDRWKCPLEAVLFSPAIFSNSSSCLSAVGCC